MRNVVDVVIKLAPIFQRLHIRFALGGAMANNYWGIVRATLDVDCLISLPAIKYQLLADELNGIGCLLHYNRNEYVEITVEKMLEQVRQRGLIECLLDSARVELFIPVVPLQEEILRRAIPVRVRGIEVPVTTAEDLILLKMVFHRPKDLHDVRGILWVQRGKLDLEYIKLWSGRTHESEVQQELERLIAEYTASESL
jgi:hypothetical protein